MTTDVPVEAWRRMLTEPQRRYVAEFRRQPEPDDAFASDLAELGLAPAISVRPLELPAAILWAVAQDEEKLNIDAFEKAMESRQVGLPVPAVFGQTPGRLDAALAFAEHVAYAPIMPVENSPVRGEALVSAITGLGTTASGAAALVVSEGSVLLAVKAGLGLRRIF